MPPLTVHTGGTGNHAVQAPYFATYGSRCPGTECLDATERGDVTFPANHARTRHAYLVDLGRVEENIVFHQGRQQESRVQRRVPQPQMHSLEGQDLDQLWTVLVIQLPARLHGQALW